MATEAMLRAPGNAHRSAGVAPHGELVMKVHDIEGFLSEWSGQDHTAQSVEQYRNYLMKLYAFLPEDHVIRRGTVREWRERLLESGYAPNTVNLHISACNTWLEYMGRREYQLLGQLNGSGRYRAALTREEYFRLLLAARAQRQERLFLMIKVFGSMGLYANELHSVTVESVREGYVYSRETGTRGAGKKRKAFFPAGLRAELMAYAEKEEIASGPVFLSREGSAIDRTTPAIQIRSLGRETGIEDGRATPSGLRLMYLANRAEAEADAARMVERELERQAALEQMIVGWNA